MIGNLVFDRPESNAHNNLKTVIPIILVWGGGSKVTYQVQIFMNHFSYQLTIVWGARHCYVE